MSRQMKGNLILLLTAFVWGMGFVSQSLGMEYIGPFTFNCLRNIIASLFLIPCIYFLQKISGEKTKPMTKAEKKYLFKGGFFCGTALFVASSFQQIGIKYTTVGKAGFITALYVIIVPILGIFMKKKVAPKKWISMVIAVTGSLSSVHKRKPFNTIRRYFGACLCIWIFNTHSRNRPFFATHRRCKNELHTVYGMRNYFHNTFAYS